MPDENEGDLTDTDLDTDLDADLDADEAGTSATPTTSDAEEMAEETGPASVIECHAVSRWHEDVLAVNNLTAHIGPGVTGLLGPNGAGKTTLIQMLIGLMKPSVGTVRVLGEDPWSSMQVRRRVGLVPDGPPPWADRSGLECAIQAGRLAGIDDDKVRDAAAHALKRVGLKEAADRRVSVYSHGMQQRLKFALAIMEPRDLLIVDEPLVGVDPVVRQDLLQLMRDLAADGTSILMSTHVLADVEALTSRILVLHQGRLRAHGDVGEIRDLLDGFPRTVRIETRDPKALGALVWPWDSVAAIESEADAVIVRTSDAARFYTALQEALLSDPIPFTKITSPDEHVETVFRYLVEQ